MFPSRPLVWYGNNPRYRTYISIMRSISSDDLLEGLLGHGLFSDVLPPIFTSEAFYDYYKKKPRPQTSKKDGSMFFLRMLDIMEGLDHLEFLIRSLMVRYATA